MELARIHQPNSAVVFHPRETHRMDLARPAPTGGALVFQPPGRRRGHHRHHHRYHNHSDPDTDSTSSSRSTSCSSDSDYDGDGARYHHHRVSFRPRHRARTRTGRGWWPSWPGGVLTSYPGAYSSPWGTTAAAAGVIGATGVVPVSASTGLVSAVVPQIQLQQQQVQAQTQQQQPRRYGYRRFHYQGGERVRSRACGHGHGNHHHHHHHQGRTQSPRRCILPRFGRWLIGDPPDRRRWRRCEDSDAGCCANSCGAETTTTTPTVHHEDEYWGPGHPTTIPNWASGSQSSPWRYGGPNGPDTSGPDTVGPGGTIEEIEEGGTVPALTAPATTTLATQPLSTATTAVLPVPVAAPTNTVQAVVDPYDQQPHHTHHYHLNDDDDRRRRRSRHAHRHHGRRGWRHNRDYDDVDNTNGILGLVERERRRDSERQMADADASHRREAMMMELMERAGRRRGRSRSEDRSRDGGRGNDDGGARGLDARDILGVLLDDVTERRGRRGKGVGEGVGGGDDGDGWKGALDALGRRVDEMILSDREGKVKEGPSPATRRTRRNEEPKVKFTQKSTSSDATANGYRNDADGPPGRKKSGAVGGNLTFSRRGRRDRQSDEDYAETDTDETSASSSTSRPRNIRARGRTLRRAGSPSTSID